MLMIAPGLRLGLGAFRAIVSLALLGPPSPPATAPPNDDGSSDAEDAVAAAADERKPPEHAYALSVRLLGAAQARAAAVDMLAPAVAVPPLVDEPEVPGTSAGVVADRAAALRWLADHAFEGPTGFSPDLHEVSAPVPGGDLYYDRDLVLTSLWITEVDATGTPTGRSWPSDRRSLVPEGTAWRSASLVPSFAPIFAAPAAVLPAAHEAHGKAYRRGTVFVLGEVDRCAPARPRTCLRWLQVVAQDGDRFTPGYLPAFMVSVDQRWVRGDGGLPRAQLIPSAVSSDRVTFILLARGLDGRLRRRAITAPLLPVEAEGAAAGAVGGDARYPEHEVRIDGKDAVVHIEGLPAMHLTVDEDLDELDPPEADLLAGP